MKHGFIRENVLENSKRGCTYKFVDWFEYSTEEQRARRLQRKERRGATLPKVKSLNDKRARKAFEWLVLNNFTSGDYSVCLTFAKPVDEKDAARLLENFLKRLRRLYRKKGTELKRVTVEERGERGGRLHYHLIVNSGGGKVSQKEIISKWEKLGVCAVEKLNADNEDLLVLCHYLEKSQKNNPKSKCLWTCSQNLTRPEVTTDDNAVSRKQMRKLQEAKRNDEVRSYIEQLYRGWRLASVPEIGANEVTERLYASFRLKRKPPYKHTARNRLDIPAPPLSHQSGGRTPAANAPNVPRVDEQRATSCNINGQPPQCPRMGFRGTDGEWTLL